MRYQETWIRGGSAKLPSQRSCADRYPVLKKFFSSYRRPFSVFDLGANLGYFSLRLTEDFDCVCVMVDNRPELLDVLLKNNSTKAVWLNTRLTPEGLWALSESECFDVVLAMSVLHHFGDRWQDALEALLSLGSYVITELPAIDDTGALNPETAVPMHNFMKKTGSRLLAEFPSHKSGKPRPCYLSKGTRRASFARRWC